ncbi:M10 family metallopeptidase C-terminal domain-containing protein [Shimia sp.]|uniref:M10 family metallopeptidase n=1 Tax=Shimia sp. TaxID=1954381 RepID=UPI0032974DC2
MLTQSEILDAMQFDLSLLNGNKLNGTGDPAYVIDYQFADNGQPADLWQTYSGWTAMSGPEKAAVRRAMDHIETFLNVSFVEVPASNDPTMNIGKVLIPGSTAGYGGYNYSAFSGGVLSDYDNFAVFDNGINLADDSAHNLILHEIGHALALKHPFGTPALPNTLENNKYTVMSYTSNPENGQDSDAMMLYDILALQDWWGATTDYNTGGTLYTGPRTNTIDPLWDTGGNDTIDASGQSGAARLDLREGYFSRFGSYDDVVIPYDVTIENAIGGMGGDTINGNSAANTLIGRQGNDTLTAFEGADSLLGGNGNDLLGGGFGYDTLRGGNGDDTVNGGVGFDLMHGDAGNDSLDGGDGADRIFGGANADTIRGGKGNDTVTGGNGRDEARLGNGFDVFTDNAQGGDAGRDTVFGGNGNDTINGGAGADVFYGEAGNDVLFGSNGFDRLLGGTNADRLYGGNGNDTLTGGLGQDQMTGGTGLDHFVFASGFGYDTIFGFEAADGENINLAGVAAITDFTDLIMHHLENADGTARIVAGANSILLDGVDFADVGVGLDYSGHDFIF